MLLLFPWSLIFYIHILKRTDNIATMVLHLFLSASPFPQLLEYSKLSSNTPHPAFWQRFSPFTFPRNLTFLNSHPALFHPFAFHSQASLMHSIPTDANKINRRPQLCRCSTSSYYLSYIFKDSSAFQGNVHSTYCHSFPRLGLLADETEKRAALEEGHQFTLQPLHSYGR